MTIRARVKPSWPIIVAGEGGVTVTQSGGRATVGFDYATSQLGAELQQAVDTTTANAVSTAADVVSANAAVTAAEAAAGALVPASQAEAEAGAVNDKGMTPLRSFEAITARGNTSFSTVDLSQPPYSLVLDNAALDQASIIQQALDDNAGKGVNVVIPANTTPTIGVGTTLLVPHGVTLQGGNGYGGWNQGHTDFTGVTLAWLGANSGTIVHLLGVNHTAVKGLKLDGNGKTGMIGLHISSVNNPSTSYVMAHHFVCHRCNKGIVLGDPGDTAYVGADGNNIGKAQTDSLDLFDFMVAGDGVDTTAVGIHLNGTNTAQSTVIRQFNLQYVNLGVHIIQNNGNLKFQHAVGGNPLGSDKAYFRYESTLLVSPSLDQCETEGVWTYAVHDSSSNSGYQYASVWTNCAFNNPILIDGSARIVSLGNNGGGTTVPWVAGGTSHVVSIMDNTNTPSTANSPWTTASSGKVDEWGDQNGEFFLKVHNLLVQSAAVSTSTTTGAAVISGGLGVAGASFFGDVVNANKSALISDIGGSAHIGALTSFPAAANIDYAGFGTDFGLVLRARSNTGGDATPLNFVNDAGASAGKVTHSATTTTYATTSDMTLKEDLRPIEAPGNTIDALRLWNFKWISTGERAVGVMAQEAFKVFPDAVSKPASDVDKWCVDYSKFTPLLLADAQQTHRRLEELERRLSLLEK